MYRCRARAEIRRRTFCKCAIVHSRFVISLIRRSSFRNRPIAKRRGRSCRTMVQRFPKNRARRYFPSIFRLPWLETQAAIDSLKWRHAPSRHGSRPPTPDPPLKHEHHRQVISLHSTSSNRRHCSCWAPSQARWCRRHQKRAKPHEKTSPVQRHKRCCCKSECLQTSPFQSAKSTMSTARSGLV